MITKEKYISIKEEVEEAISELFKKTISTNFNNYFLFLNNCILINNEIKFDNDDALKDENRLNFYTDFLNKNYAFGNNENEVKDDINRFFVELMIFTHFWESKHIINQLAQIAKLSIGEDYDLNIYKKHPYHKSNLVKEKSSNSIDKIHAYIRGEIKQKFINSNLKIGELFPKSYNSQIRNAFAHSDFYFSLNEKKLFLKNFNKNEKHTLENISFNEWTERFCYTFLISFLLEKKIKMDYNRFVQENKTFEIEISNNIYISKYNSVEKRFLFIEKSLLTNI